jgi:lipopolysaccharide biosynthesis glycosyltransferase
MQKELKVFIGYDPKESEAWDVCSFSILRHSGNGVTTHPIKQSVLRELGLYIREKDQGASTEFSISRFLTPFLSANSDWSIFVDCDFLFNSDIFSVLNGLDPEKALYVVKHDYVPSQSTKMDGAGQSVYPRKNWSSFMVFNNNHPDVRRLTPALVNSSSPKHLHRFEWVTNQEEIGELPLTWNFLVGEYPKPSIKPHAIHYTNGGPWFSDCQRVDFAEEWLLEYDLFKTAKSQ